MLPINENHPEGTVLTAAADHLHKIGGQVRDKSTWAGDPLRREYGRMKASFIKLAVLMGEPDAARKLIERGD
jgi:hypothetical protein